MENWYSEIMKPSVFAPVVLSVLLASVFAWIVNLIKRGVSFGFGFLSSRWANRSEKRRNQWTKRVVLLSHDADARADERHQELKLLIQSGIMGVAAVLTLVFQNEVARAGERQVFFHWFFQTMLLVTLIMMVVTVFQAGNHRRALTEAKKLRTLLE